MWSKNPRADNSSDGSAWVNRFLLPRLRHQFPNARSVSCLQISPDDSSEAERLREIGYPCEMTEPTAAMKLSFPDSSWDFAFSGRFPSRAPDRETRITLAKEMHRVLRRGGAVLLALGNRACPVDLTRNGALLHGASARHCLTLREACNIMVDEAGFRTAGLLNVHGHFGWGSLSAMIRPLGRILDAHWRYFATPARKWLYASPLNPTLILWFNKN